MSMILKKIDRTELIRRLGLYVSTDNKMADAKVFVAKRTGEKLSIVKVKQTDMGVFLYPYKSDAPEIAMAKFMGSDMHEHKLGELVSALEKCSHESVWLQWPTWNDAELEVCVGQTGSLSVVGRYDEVYLFPVPKDIERVNEEVRKMCADRGCVSAQYGLQCGECPRCGECGILKEVDEKITNERDGK